MKVVDVCLQVLVETAPCVEVGPLLLHLSLDFSMQLLQNHCQLMKMHGNSITELLEGDDEDVE